MEIKLSKNDLKLFGKLLFRHGAELRESLLEKMDSDARDEYERAMDLLATIDEAMFEKKKQVRKKRAKKTGNNVMHESSDTSDDASRQASV